MGTNVSSRIVLKLGGSVLGKLPSYQACACLIRDRLRNEAGSRFVVVVSARCGETDELLALARAVADPPDPPTLDLLWSTGEIRSAATLALCLHAEGVRAVALDVHQTGIRRIDRLDVDPAPLRRALDAYDVVIVPGFLASGHDDAVVTLGRGGSDLSAVALAAALPAERCELVKDVPGYFTTDPNRRADAQHLSAIDYERALTMAQEGCDLVQPAALEAARRAGLTLVIRAAHDPQHTIVSERSGLAASIASRAAGVQRPERHLATRAIHTAQPSEPETGALVAPIFQTSTFEQLEPGLNRGFDYSRTNNPTRQRLERVLADLEGVEYGAVFASGLAAENAVMQAYLKPGDEVLIGADVYGGTYRLLTKVYQPAGVAVRHVDFTDLEAVGAALTERTRLVWIESPTNPRLLVCDIAAVARLAHAVGALVAVDNTFATPCFQQPFTLGADLVVHSVTKYLAGHSDLIQGAVLARDPGVFEPVKFLQNAAGAVPGPFDCWLTLRGLKTLELRMQRHAENAAAIARLLADHPAVTRVYYPGLAGHPGHHVAQAQMSGFGGIVSCELDATLDGVTAFVSGRRYFVLGESLGGVKSLICHPARMTHASIPAAARAALGLADTLVRLSPGCENAVDLLDDLREGLDALTLTSVRSAPAVGAI